MGWIVSNNEEHFQLFTNPRETWLEVEWWKVLLVSVPILLICFKFLPMLERFIESSLGVLAKNPSKTSQYQVAEATTNAIGFRWGLVVAGLMYSTVAVAEELIFRGGGHLGYHL